MDRIKKEIIRVGGTLREIITITDEKTGQILHKLARPLMVEFKLKDVLQVIIGSTILAIPVGFTEETWVLGANLPFANIFGFMIISIFFIALFVYYNYHRVDGMKPQFGEFSKRVVFTYLLSFLVVAILLTLIEKAPWQMDFLLAFKRTVLVAFPASMSAAIADMIK